MPKKIALKKTDGRTKAGRARRAKLLASASTLNSTAPADLFANLQATLAASRAAFDPLARAFGYALIANPVSDSQGNP